MSDQPQLDLTPCPTDSHPIVGGRVLLPNATFSARNRVSGRQSTYLYVGCTGITKSGELYVDCVDKKGHGHTIAVDTITYIRKMKAA